MKITNSHNFNKGTICTVILINDNNNNASGLDTKSSAIASFDIVNEHSRLDFHTSLTCFNTIKNVKIMYSRLETRFNTNMNNCIYCTHKNGGSRV